MNTVTPAQRPNSVSLCDLLLLGYLDASDIQEGGYVSSDRRIAAERAYSTFQEYSRIPSTPQPSPSELIPPPLVRSAPIGPQPSRHFEGRQIRRHSNIVDLTAPSSSDFNGGWDCRRRRATLVDLTHSDDTPDANGLECIVCFQNSRQYACVPCFHLTVCSTCVTRLERCPTCRCRSESFQRVFVP